MIVIIDYKMGNIYSILNILKRMGQDAIVSDKMSDILQADKLILPGVGAFDTGMNNLEALGLLEALNHQVLERKTPILGICIGMQLMAKNSEEGIKTGLGWFDAEVKRFDFSHLKTSYRVPCVGWNIVQPAQPNFLLSGTDEKRFYFVHSYYVECYNRDNIVATAKYGFEYTVALNHENIYGVQFHPEKSHKFGLKLFKQFVEGI